MKDLEKIKSEDLAAQVQDANPANFAIEQEVAQLVGATVPAPTEPSADDARELGAQLLVFLRRALTPIQSALRTAVAAIYTHLDSRCTDYTPAAYASFTPTHHAYDPMGSTPRTLPNLLQALTAFSARKISNGSATDDGIPDGTSLAQIVCKGSSVLEIKDDNTDWVWNDRVESYGFRPITSTFPNAKRMTVNCDSISVNAQTDVYILSGGNWEEFYAPYAKSFTNIWYSPLFKDCTKLRVIYMPLLDVCTSPRGTYIGDNCPLLQRIVLGKIVGFQVGTSGSFVRSASLDLIDIEFGQGLSASMNLSSWNPTNALDASRTDLIEEGSTAENNLQQFLLNFKNHIALRLTTNGSGKTLTLSQAVFSAVIEGSSPICDDIKGIIEDKGWKVQDTNNNIFPTT